MCMHERADPRPALRAAAAAQEPRVYGRGGSDPRAWPGSEHGHLQRARRGHVAELAGTGAAATGVVWQGAMGWRPGQSAEQKLATLFLSVLSRVFPKE